MVYASTAVHAAGAASVAGAANPASAIGAKVSAISTFFTRPIASRKSPAARLSHCGRLFVASRELRHHLAVVQDRAREQVREEGHEQRVVDEHRLLRLAAMDVDQVRDLREREEADAERQREVQEVRHVARDARGVREEEVGVLEHAQQCEVRSDAECEHPAARTPAQRGRDREVECNAAGDERQVPRIPPPVEEERRERKPRLRGERAPAEQEEDDERPRQEPEEVLVAVEQHRGVVREQTAFDLRRRGGRASRTRGVCGAYGNPPPRADPRGGAVRRPHAKLP